MCSELPQLADIARSALNQITRPGPSNSMLGCGSTTPQDYPECSVFDGRREREWVARWQRPPA